MRYFIVKGKIEFNNSKKTADIEIGWIEENNGFDKEKFNLHQKKINITMKNYKVTEYSKEEYEGLKYK